MVPIIEDSILGSDLDCRFFSLLNLGSIEPVPDNVAAADHPGLDDERPPAAGSVTNESVAPDAAIEQSKLSLDGQIPPAWLGTTATTAAQGDLAEYLSNKNQPGGYAGLDSGGKVPAAQLPAAVGTGTVTSVGLTMPAQFAVSGTPVTGAGTLAATWALVADLSWFGNNSGGSAAPQFYTTPLPVSLIPDLDAAKVTSGVLPVARLPVAVGLGLTHAPGAVPDPGDGTGGALATNYLARDMTYKPVPTIGVAYQPTLPNPTFDVSAVPGYPLKVLISCTVSATIFYSLTSSSTGFSEAPESGSISVSAAGTVWAYAAHPGYNNSTVVSQVV